MGEAIAYYADLIANAIAGDVERADLVVELGCGYGYQLWNLWKRFPHKSYAGGEFTAKGVEVAQRLFQSVPSIRVEQMDLCAERYSPLESVAGRSRVVVFTAYSVEDVPSAAHVISVLAKYRDSILRVFHFEPTPELHGDSLLGLLRRRYSQVNGYNQNLVSDLRARTDVELLRVEANVFGLNPLNPFSVLEWRFR